MRFGFGDLCAMNMVCVNADWAYQGQRGSVIEVRREDVVARPANRPVISDPYRKIGSFAETAPEDRAELLDLLEKAFASI